jgi:hypothetical protein
MKLNRVLIIFLLLLFCILQLSSKTLEKVKDFSSIKGHNEKQFGFRISSNSSIKRVAVSAPQDREGGVRSGAVYIFDNKGKQLSKIKSPQVELNNAFGYSISLGNEYLLVGSPGFRRFYKKGGKAFLYKRDSNDKWNCVNSLTAPSQNNFDLYGHDVLLKNNYLFITAPDNKSNNGAVYIYKKNANSKLELIYTIKSSSSSKFYGASVSFDGEFLVVGAPYENDYNGAIYIYKYHNDSNWELVQHIEADRRIQLGTKLVINDNIIASTTNDGVSGKVYIYDLKDNKWTFQQALAPRNGGYIYDFGKGLRVTDKYVFVGAPKYGDKKGALFIYEKHDGKFKYKTNTEYQYFSRYDDYWGSDVEVYNENMLLIGAPGNMYKNGFVSVLKTDFRTMEVLQKEQVQKKSNIPPVSNKTQVINQSRKKVLKKKKRKKVKLNRIIALRTKKHLGSLKLNELKQSFVKLENRGNSPLIVDKIYSSDNIKIYNKSTIKIEPQDFYQLGFTYVQTKSNKGFIEFSSNKTKGNNRIEIKSSLEKNKELKYSAELKKDLGVIKLGNYKDFVVKVKNEGDVAFTISYLDIPKDLEIINAKREVLPKSDLFIKFRVYSKYEGKNSLEIKYQINKNKAVLTTKIDFVGQLGGNEMFLKNSGIIITPNFQEKRLLINTTRINRKKVKVLITKMSGELVKKFDLDPSFSGFICIPTDKLGKGNFLIKVVEIANDFLLSQAMFKI